MSKNQLASYVEEFILNPAKSRKPNIDDDGNEETVAICDKKIEGNSVKEAFASVSKLRQKNAQLLGEADPRYRGKKTSRKKISKEEEASFDPELAKFCIIEEDETTDDEDSQLSDSEKDDGKNDASSDYEKEDSENDTASDYDKNKLNYNPLDIDYMKMAEDAEEFSDEDGCEEDDDSTMDDGKDYDKDDTDGDEDDDNSDYGEDNYHDNDNLNKFEEDSLEQSSSKIQTFSKNEVVEMPKGIAVKNQCYIFDKLFEARIGLQKVAAISNQLPQCDKFKPFLDNANYPLYKEKLLAARKEVKKLMIEIVKLQGTTLKNNQETADLIECEENQLEEKSEIETKEKKDSKGSKRKLEEFEEILRKRHKNIVPFRDGTLNKWYEKSKLLINQTKKSNFDKFEIPPAIQIKNILANKDDLLKRTRLIGGTRGKPYKIMGKQDTFNLEEYDPEIFDDLDFYNRMLEDFLKSKVSISDDMAEVSKRFVDIQKLRNKAKKKVEAKASKGRKLRHQVITKQQNFMAPCKYSVMTDEATNKLFTSLFLNSNK